MLSRRRKKSTDNDAEAAFNELALQEDRPILNTGWSQSSMSRKQSVNPNSNSAAEFDIGAISKHQMASYLAIFEELDEDESGCLSASEYASFVGISETEALKMMNEIDDNSDGEIQFEEFVHLMWLASNQINYDKDGATDDKSKAVDISQDILEEMEGLSDDVIDNLKKAFAEIDDDGSGGISVPELCSRFHVSESDARAGLASVKVGVADPDAIDSDAEMNMDEFIELMRRTGAAEEFKAVGERDNEQVAKNKAIRFRAALLDIDDDSLVERLHDAFGHMDDDASGSLSADEFALHTGISEKDAIALMSEADEDGDYELDFDEFVVILHASGQLVQLLDRIENKIYSGYNDACKLLQEDAISLSFLERLQGNFRLWGLIGVMQHKGRFDSQTKRRLSVVERDNLNMDNDLLTARFANLFTNEEVPEETMQDIKSALIMVGLKFDDDRVTNIARRVQALITILEQSFRDLTIDEQLTMLQAVGVNISKSVICAILERLKAADDGSVSNATANYRLISATFRLLAEEDAEDSNMDDESSASLRPMCVPYDRLPSALKMSVSSIDAMVREVAAIGQTAASFAQYLTTFTAETSTEDLCKILYHLAGNRYSDNSGMLRHDLEELLGIRSHAAVVDVTDIGDGSTEQQVSGTSAAVGSVPNDELMLGDVIELAVAIQTSTRRHEVSTVPVLEKSMLQASSGQSIDASPSSEEVIAWYETMTLDNEDLTLLKIIATIDNTIHTTGIETSIADFSLRGILNEADKAGNLPIVVSLDMFNVLAQFEEGCVFSRPPPVNNVLRASSSFDSSWSLGGMPLDVDEDEIPDSRMTRYRDIFEKLDADGSNSISKQELMDALMSPSDTTEIDAACREAIFSLIEMIESNDDRELTLDDIVTALEAMVVQSPGIGNQDDDQVITQLETMIQGIDDAGSSATNPSEQMVQFIVDLLDYFYDKGIVSAAVKSVPEAIDDQDSDVENGGKLGSTNLFRMTTIDTTDSDSLRAPGIDSKRLAAYRIMFSCIDKDGGGTIDKEELTSTLMDSQLSEEAKVEDADGVQHADMVAVDVIFKLLEVIDAMPDGELDFDSFVEAIEMTTGDSDVMVANEVKDISVDGTDDREGELYSTGTKSSHDTTDDDVVVDTMLNLINRSVSSDHLTGDVTTMYQGVAKPTLPTTSITASALQMTCGELLRVVYRLFCELSGHSYVSCRMLANFIRVPVNVVVDVAASNGALERLDFDVFVDVLVDARIREQRALHPTFDSGSHMIDSSDKNIHRVGEPVGQDGQPSQSDLVSLLQKELHIARSEVASVTEERARVEQQFSELDSLRQALAAAEARASEAEASLEREREAHSRAMAQAAADARKQQPQASSADAYGSPHHPFSGSVRGVGDGSYVDHVGGSSYHFSNGLKTDAYANRAATPPLAYNPGRFAESVNSLRERLHVAQTACRRVRVSLGQESGDHLPTSAPGSSNNFNSFYYR